MRFKYGTRTVLGLAMLVVFGLFSAVHRLASTAGRFRLAPDKDPYARIVERFERLGGRLPSHGVIGYVTDDDVERWVEFYVAQYALSPVIVAKGVDHELVVGNFHDSASGQRICESKGLTPVKDLGDGLILLRGKTK